MTYDKHFLSHIDRLIQQRPISEKTLVPFRDLVLIMIQAEPGLEPIVLEEGLKDIKREEGFPLFSREDLPLDLDTVSVLLARFLEHLGQANRNDKGGLQKALEKSKRAPDWALTLIEGILRQDEDTLAKISKDTGLDPEVLRFLGRVALRPSLHAMRDTLSQQIDREGWDHGYCPVCGSQPCMAYFAKTGKKYLHCELCGEEWAYPRLRCPFCQNQDHETLGYFQAEEEEGFRVDYCKKCLRYLKTIDRRVFEEEAPMELEHLATIHLDILAAEQGFR
ncbi:MAG: formate dehydrogenase accessory protein FdhE [Deltaproteobacteria bacterium]|nr:formate dehydrogenase accessory protein FdhE [Deltaproteobacteria bacterium]